MRFQIIFQLLSLSSIIHGQINEILIVYVIEPLLWVDFNMPGQSGLHIMLIWLIKGRYCREFIYGGPLILW